MKESYIIKILIAKRTETDAASGTRRTVVNGRGNNPKTSAKRGSIVKSRPKARPESQPSRELALLLASVNFAKAGSSAIRSCWVTKELTIFCQFAIDSVRLWLGMTSPDLIANSVHSGIYRGLRQTSMKKTKKVRSRSPPSDALRRIGSRTYFRFCALGLKAGLEFD